MATEEVSSSFISPAESEKVQALRVRIEKLTLTDAQRTWLTDITYARFLRARNHDVDKSCKMLSTTLKWRNERIPEAVRCAVCPKNPYSHSLRPIGLDRIGRPVLYSHFHVDNRVAEDNIVHLIHLLEKLFQYDFVREQNYVWVMDFSGFSVADMNPNFSIQALKMFQAHYPERMGIAVVYDAPKSFKRLYGILRPFVDEKTRKKLRFVNHGSDLNDFSDLFGEELIRRVELEVQLTRSAPRREFWKEPPVAPMVDLKFTVA